MASANVLVLIHGMTLEQVASTHSPSYKVLWDGLKQREPALAQRIDRVVEVEWGHKPVSSMAGGLRDDEKLTDAENQIYDSSSYGKVSADASADNHLHPNPPWDLLARATRQLTTPLKERILILGFTDALYYCSADGERAVRDAVYGQVLSKLDEFRPATDVRLHIVAGSLGATVAFDFLFGLFAPDDALSGGIPGFVVETEDPVARERFEYWRGRAQAPPQSLHLASKTTTGAQIPLMMMRKQKLVDALAARQRLDPTVIGVPKRGPPKWLIFYDVDDILGFPTRRLFDAQGTIQEHEVETGLNPTDAHGRYWTNQYVVGEIATLIRANL